MTDVSILDEQRNGLLLSFRVGLPAARVDRAVDARLQTLGRTVPVPGFRPGRAPLAVLRRHHGSRVRRELVDRMAIDVARGLLVERKLEPVARPTIVIEEDDPGAPPESVVFTLQLEVAPEVRLAPLDGITLRRLRAPGQEPALAADADAHLRRQLFDALLTRHDFAVPPDMVDNEYRRIARGFETAVGEPVDTELERELRSIAERRIRLAILLTEIGHTHDIRLSREEIEALVERQAERDPGHQDEIIDYYLDHPTALAELQSPLFEDRVVEFLLTRCEIDEIEMSADELRATLERT